MSVGKVSYILRQAHDAYIEYRVGLPQRPAKPLVSPATSPMVENMDGNGQENPLPVFVSIFIIENRIRVGKAEIGCESGMYEYSKTDKYGRKDD